MELLFLCLKIFVVRILDVSMGTIRTIITVKGRRMLASMVGFVEVFIWFLIVREALNTTETSIWIAVSYSLGFATGTYIGSLLSDIFISGTLGLQIITSKDDQELVRVLRENGYAVTVIDVRGMEEDKGKFMLMIEIDKKKINHLKSLIKKLDPKAFIIVNETKYVQNGYFK